ncbi:MAG: S41 family peptidase [Lachnospiraceae bacterium]
MDRKFLKGMLTGSFGVLLAVAVMIFIGGCTKGSEAPNDSNILKVEANDRTAGQTDGAAGAEEGSTTDSDTVATPSATTGEEKFITDFFTGKLELLENLIEWYYMDETTVDALQTGAYKGMLEALGDPYSCYYTAEEYAALMESTNGIYCGIGAYVSQNVNTKIITIIKPFVDGPAYNAGMLPGDIIYKVDDVDVTGMDINSVVAMMKGEPDTKVTVTVVREGVSDPIELEITRGVIEVPTIEYEMLADNIGYVLISEFDEVTVDQFKNAVEALKADGMRALVIDLRDNPGGLLSSVVDMLDYMLPKGLIVYTEDKYGDKEEYRSTDEETFELPLAVLINGNSASASEIFAAAVQDYELGTLVGTTSFGKGIVQSIFPLSDGTAVKLTIARYYTPSGRCIHGIGVEPDIVVELADELKQKVTIEHEEDNQLQEAIDYLLEGLKEVK